MDAELLKDCEQAFVENTSFYIREGVTPVMSIMDISVLKWSIISRIIETFEAK